MQFNKPKSGGAFISARDMIDHLVLFIEVKDSWERFDDMRGEQAKVLVCDFVDLDGDGEYQVNVQTSDKYIVAKLNVGDKMVLGRIAQLPPKKAGWQGAIVLNPYEDETDIAKAQSWVDKQNIFSKPTTPKEDPLPF